MRFLSGFYRRRLLVFFSPVFFLLFFPAWQGLAGANIDEDIFSPVAVAGGRSLYSPDNPLENQLYLGGALGAFQRPGFYGGYGRLTRAGQYWGSVFLPGSTGVFGVAYEHTADDFSGSLSHGFVQLGYGKNFTSNLSFGLLLKYSYRDLVKLQSAIGLDPSLIYSVQPVVKPGRVFALHHFFIYSALRGIEVNMPGATFNPLFNPSLNLGFGARLIKLGWFSTGFQAEGAVDTLLKTSPVVAALNFGFSLFQVRLGYRMDLPLDRTLNVDNLFGGSLSVGAGLQYAFNGLTVDGQYAITGFETGNFEHRVAIGAIFNYEDKTAPVLTATVNHDNISPNGDGRNDYVVFHIGVKGSSPVRQWKLEIKNAKGEKVRTFEKDFRKRSEDFSPYRLFTDLFKPLQYRYIPETIIWDGTADRLNTTAPVAVNMPEIKLPEGPYFYEMTVTDEKGMTGESVRGTIVIDTTYPDVVVKRDAKSEFRNAKIFLAVSQYASSQNDDLYSVSIFNDAGVAVRTFSWKGGTNLPRMFTWDGLDQKGSPVPAGLYRYQLRAEDLASNQTLAEIDHVNVTYGETYVDLLTEAPGFSPNEDGSFDTLGFSLTFLSNTGNGNNTNFQANVSAINTWKVFLTREKINDLKDFIFDSAAGPEVFEKSYFKYDATWSGDKDTFLAPKQWTGKDQDGRPLPDGRYFLTLVAKTKDGAMLKSESAPVLLDTTPPDISLGPEKDKITPDGDLIGDTQFLRTSAKDESGIKSYTLNLYETLTINDQKTRVLFKKWSAKNAIPGKFFIEGVGDTGLSMESIKEYEYEIEADDIYDNRVKKVLGRFHTGPLVQPFGAYLKITLTGLKQGKINSWGNSGSLNQVYDVLVNDYPQYRIRVEGHTGSGGGEEVNIIVSEKKAKSIMEYFISKGMPRNRIGFQGFGEVVPLTEIEGDIANYKNNRVEFILLK